MVEPPRDCQVRPRGRRVGRTLAAIKPADSSTGQVSLFGFEPRNWDQQRRWLRIEGSLDTVVFLNFLGKGMDGGGSPIKMMPV
jgi:hypothetical protein